MAAHLPARRDRATILEIDEVEFELDRDHRGQPLGVERIALGPEGYLVEESGAYDRFADPALLAELVRERDPQRLLTCLPAGGYPTLYIDLQTLRDAGVLDRLAVDRSRVFGAHMPFPALGHGRVTGWDGGSTLIQYAGDPTPRSIRAAIPPSAAAAADASVTVNCRPTSSSVRE